MAGAALSVVLPAFNEASKIAGTLEALRAALADLPGGCEFVVSDDGSTDATVAEVEKLAASDSRIRLVRNPHRGRGGALKGGLAAAEGEIVVTIDADLSYGPADALRLFEHLQKYPGCDLVIGSCYMPGGRVEGVPAKRLWVSKVGNRLLRFAFHGRFYTTTGILRGYRKEKLQALLPTLVSDGKELYLEFLHKALAAGWAVAEVPATLSWRRNPDGGSFHFLPTASSHLGFLAARRQGSLLVFGVALGCLPVLVWCATMLLYLVLARVPIVGPLLGQLHQATGFSVFWEWALEVGGALLLGSVGLWLWTRHWRRCLDAITS